MSCYHPLKAFKIGKLASGKDDLKVCSYETDHVELDRSSQKWIPTSVPIVTDRAVRVCREFVTIPCGQCIGCRLDYSKQWADRCLMELESHSSSYFVTLTYNDVRVPLSYYTGSDDAEAWPSMSLRKRDLQLFFKRLRSKTGQEIRYYASGEYGSRSARPHYHCIIFGFQLDDLVPYKKSHEGFQYYTSELLQSVWRGYAYNHLGAKIPGSYGDLGFCIVAEVTWETCAYTARYVAKKATGQQAEFYSTFNLEPEFAVMSRNPGIGKNFYERHRDSLYEFDHVSISTPKGGRQVRAPRYFDLLLDHDDPDLLQEVKAQRKVIVDNLNKMKMMQYEGSYLEMLAHEESVLKDKIKSLKRSEI